MPSLPVSLWARVALFWLLLLSGLGQVPLIAQSTTPGPRPQDGRPLSVMVSTDSLIELWNSLEDTKNKWKASQSESEDLRARLEIGETKVAELSKLVGKLEVGSMDLLTSLEESSKREASLSQAAETRQKLDQEAIDQARKERDEARAMLPWVGFGGVIVGIISAIGVNCWKR